MAVRVIDLLEAVQIDEAQAEAAIAAPGPGHGAVELLDELRAVGQAGKHVKAGQQGELA